MNPKRPFPGPPVIKLGNEFRKVNDYNNRINGIPNIIELDQLTIAGDVVIGTDVTLKGTVIVVANHGSHIDIPPGSILENKVNFFQFTVCLPLVIKQTGCDRKS
eukprot:TRINITY_DN2097_c0_g1_i1.p1 TRINITY_DN2097_c0_g1~~TRINITY_DN2097_c0_g1_i1.p1  ORF type:complete len:104 (+),score=12.04 TRINITY_DN2097_c0_g1_i1:235-546(+)